MTSRIYQRLLVCFSLWIFVGLANGYPAPPPKPQPTPAPSPPPRYVPKMENVEVPPPVELPAVPASEVLKDVPNTPMGADEAALIALRHQYQVTVARTSVQAAAGRTQQVRAALNPSIVINYSYTQVLTSSASGAAGSVPSASSGASALSAGSSGGTTGGSTSGSTTGGTTGSSTSSTGGPTNAFTSASTPSTTNLSGSVSGLSASGSQLTVSLRQLLFDFNHNRDLVRQSRELEGVALQNLTAVQQTLVLQVKQAFYTYVQNQRLIGVNEENLRDQQEHLRQAQARYQAGLGLPSDVVRSEAAVSDAIFNLTQARATADISRVSLLNLMGIDPRTPLQANDSDEPDADTSNPQGFFDTALRQRPEVAQAAAQLRADQYALKAARTTNAPSLNASLSYSGRFPNDTPRSDSLSAILALQWTPLDGGLTAGAVKQARANLESGQAQLYGAQQSVLQDVAQSYINLKTAEQRLKTAMAEEANATEAARLASGRFRAGLGILLDVLDAESALLQARTNRVNAVSALNQSRAAMQRAIGTPLPPAK